MKSRRDRESLITKIATAAMAAGLGLAAAGLAAAPEAQADGILTSYEKYAGDDSWYATCRVFDDMFTGRVSGDIPVAVGVTQALSREYAAARRWGGRGQLPGLELLPAALGQLVRHRRERPYRDGHGTVSVAQSR